MTNDTFAERFNEALDDAGFPPKGKGRQRAVKDKFSVSQQAARKWLEGEAIPRTTRLVEIATEVRVNFEWLLSGRGPKRTEPEDDKHHSSDAATDSRLEYLLLYASPRSREALKRIAQAAHEGRLTDDDIALLEQTAMRIAKQTRVGPGDYSNLMQEPTDD